jgi:hypothetical protein
MEHFKGIKGRWISGTASLQQSDGLGVISFKSQLADFGSEGRP